MLQGGGEKRLSLSVGDLLKLVTSQKGIRDVQTRNFFRVTECSSRKNKNKNKKFFLGSTGDKRGSRLKINVGSFNM